MFQAWLVKMAKIAAHSAPSSLPGNRPQEERDGEGEEAQHRHRLQDVERRHDHQLGLAALGGERRHHEGEQQRGDDGGEHAQRRAQRVFRQVGGIERDRLAGQPHRRCRHLVRAVRNQHEAGRDQDEDREVVEIGQEPFAAQPERLGDRAAFADHRHPRFLCFSSVAPTGKRERERLSEARPRDLVLPGERPDHRLSRTATATIGRGVARSRVHRVPCSDRRAGEYAPMANPSSGRASRSHKVGHRGGCA